MRLGFVLGMLLVVGCSSSSSGNASDGGIFGAGGIGSGGSGGAPTGCGTTAACEPPTAATLNGEWLFALAATLGPTKPFLFRATVSATDGEGVSWQWTLVPLDAKTRLPLPEPPITLVLTTIPPNASWSTSIPQPLTIPGVANPLTGSDVEVASGLTLSGAICGGRTFYCGDVTGSISKPIPLDLKGSKWTLQRAPAPGTLPEEIFVSCDCHVADSLAP